jgi:hypothetical protein
MPTKQISQKSLCDYLLAKKKHDELAEKLRAKEKEFQDALGSGAVVAGGVLTAFIKTWERRDVSWKAVVEREIGEEYAKRVLAATQPQKYSKLVVEAAA